MGKRGESSFSIAIFLLTLLIVAWIPQVRVSASRGPRTEELIMQFYANVSTAYHALVAGDVDVVGSELPQSLYVEATANPNIALAPVDDMGMYEFDLHNNYSIHSYPGIRSPTSYTAFRQALAFLVDKDRIVNEFCGGFAVRMDQPIPAPAHGWMNQSYTGANYPYPYDPAAASALLDANGWAEGGTPNPYYDAAFPGSTPNLRTYPPGHETAGADIDPLIFYIRSDDPRRLQAGQALQEAARKIGIPSYSPPPISYYDAIFLEKDYHIYTGAWSLGGAPPQLHTLYHTYYYFPFGSNYVTGYQADNATPAHPALDSLLDSLTFSDTFEQALKNTQLTLGLFTELCVSIPLFGPRAFCAYSTQLLGAVNMDGRGFENDYFFLNAYKADGSPIRWGVITPPENLNILHSTWSDPCGVPSDPFWYSDYQCLNRIYDSSALAMMPYDMVMHQPGLISDWEEGLWEEGGITRAKLTLTFRSDSYFVDAQTGAQLEEVDADTYLFSKYAHYVFTIGNIILPGSHFGIRRFNKTDTHTVEIYSQNKYWGALPYYHQPLLPRRLWLNETKGMCTQRVDTFVVGVNLTTPGQAELPDHAVWFNNVTANGSLLTSFKDYFWEYGDVWITKPLSPGTRVVVNYWTMANTSYYAYGYTPNDLPWQEILIGSGMYYVTGLNVGEGGNLTLKCNPNYWMDTPILGEMDFRWEAGGYYEVTIFDIVKAAGAYGSQGISVPDRNWLPGADVAPPGGVIDIFDIVTIASQYGQISGAPP